MGRELGDSLALDQPVRATLLKESDSQISHQLSTAPQLGVGLDRPFLLYVQLLSGLILPRSSEGEHSCCEFMNEAGSVRSPLTSGS